MNAEPYRTRRIFRSSLTSQDTIRELFQILCLAELLDPSEEMWLVSPWISDPVLLDNRGGGFDSVNPQWRRREIRLSDFAVQAMTNTTRVVVVTRPDVHNETFIERLRERASETGVRERLEVILAERLHVKGILTAAGLLSGSMNLTYSGLELNDELVLFETSPEAVAQARLAFRHYRSGRSDER